jgi:uncharacterized protein YcfL
MKLTIACVLASLMITSCGSKKQTATATQQVLPIQGTWKLLSGTLIEKGIPQLRIIPKNYPSSK